MMSKMRSFHLPQLKGFTLIEILLVVAILGILATLSISYYEKRLTTAKVEKSALEMQGIMQAASAFLVDYNQWPNQHISTCEYQTGKNCILTVMPSNFIPYLPGTVNSKGQLINPWGYPYKYDPSVWPPTPTPLDQKINFEVFSQTPTPQIAQQLAAALPYGGLDPNDATKTTVIVYQVFPSQQTSSNNQTILIRAIGDTGTYGDNTELSLPQTPFTCPPGWTPQMALMLNRLVAYSAPYAPDSCNKHFDTTMSNVSLSKPSCGTAASGGYQCKITFNAEARNQTSAGYPACSTTVNSYSTIGYGNSSYTYIAYCQGPS